MKTIMNKPLTMEELNAIRVDDWIWVVDLLSPERSLYVQIAQKLEDGFWLYNERFDTEYNSLDYGTKWLSYKNKEQAEAKGEIIEAPSKIGDKIYIIDPLKAIIIEGTVCMMQQKSDKSWAIRCTYYNNSYKQRCTHNYKDSEMGKIIFKYKIEAEMKLKELNNNG